MQLIMARARMNHRVSPGGDAYWNNVVSLLHFDGTDGSTSIVDAAGKTAWTANGTAKITTSNSKFGGSSLRLDGAGYLSAVTPSAVDLGENDFTIECFANLSTTPSTAAALFATWVNSTTNKLRPLITSSMNLQLAAENALVWQGGTVGSIGAWQHIAITRSGSNSYGFVNGTLIVSKTSWPSPISAANYAAEIGRNLQNNAWFINGYLDQFRVTKGIARYTANFTPPTAPFPDN